MKITNKLLIIALCVCAQSFGTDKQTQEMTPAEELFDLLEQDFSSGDTRKVYDFDKVKLLLKQHPELAKKIEVQTKTIEYEKNKFKAQYGGIYYPLLMVIDLMDLPHDMISNEKFLELINVIISNAFKNGFDASTEDNIVGIAALDLVTMITDDFDPRFSVEKKERLGQLKQDVLKILIHNRAPVNAKVEEGAFPSTSRVSGLTGTSALPLTWAVSNSWLAGVKILVEEGKADLSIHEDGATILDFARKEYELRTDPKLIKKAYGVYVKDAQERAKAIVDYLESRMQQTNKKE